ncbi:hypothetical protein BJX61DRAFT_56044 [Aspergillus egyptiacus]|nr:hypothetical protein BJX61DRAFT_56044 [Aspergillus egyptiacus]
MHHISSRANQRGALSTYREQDSDEDGLLRPITRETTRSRWGSDSTGLAVGGRRGSVLDGIDKDIPLGLSKRLDEIRSMDELQRVRDQRTKGEQYLRSALSVIGTLATDITRRLDYTYYGLLEKLAALNMTIFSFQELSDSTNTLFDDFQQEISGLEQDIRREIGDLHEFQPQMERIKTLEERVRASRTKATALGRRLEAMRNEIGRWDEREMEWQMRTNQRLRIFWGVITGTILAILVAIVLQHWPDETTAAGFGALPKALKLTNFTSSIPLPKKLDTSIPGASTSEYPWSPELSAMPSNGTSISVPANIPTSFRTDESARPTDYDPLRMFDEL